MLPYYASLISNRTFDERPHSIYHEIRRADNMKKKKYLVTYEEWRLIIYALNRLRNDLLAKGKYTDTVDDALLAVVKAKTKRVKVAG